MFVAVVVPLYQCVLACARAIPALQRQPALHILALLVVIPVPNDSTGAAAGNRHYSAGAIEEALPY